LADVFLFAAVLANARPLVYPFVALPFEYSEGAETDTAFLSEVLLQHPNVRVLSVALIAGHWEIR
jgi:hypothetical protein